MAQAMIEMVVQVMSKNLIYCKDEDIKNKLLQYGLPLLKSSDGFFVFANVGCKYINFDDISDKVVFSNKMKFM